MKRRILTLLLLCPALLALSRTILVERPDQDISKEGWRYTLKVNNRGTRSEGWTGTLYWQNSPVPSRFHSLQCPLGRFTFAEGRHLWGEHGWIRRDRGTNKTDTAVKITGAEIRRGWYKGTVKKHFTPGFWVLAGRNNGYYWVDPGKLAALAAANNWSLLKAHGWRGQLGE